MFVKVIDHNIRVQFFETQCSACGGYTGNMHPADVSNSGRQSTSMTGELQQ